ncbi:MAG: MerR family DNA-binding transcriptional regulator, partial [Clostridia bacterium]|nr:MerR family DNA-binding transcriptional regulator [Clostridia bacterium]
MRLVSIFFLSDATHPSCIGATPLVTALLYHPVGRLSRWQKIFSSLPTSFEKALDSPPCGGCIIEKKKKEERSLLRIGQFSKLGKITVKTLRYYDKIGLLKPAMIDSSSSYRYYTVEQLKTLHLI